MSYSYEFSYLLNGMLTTLSSSILGIAGYVLTALALYTLARRRGLSKPWLSWVPVINVWILGSLSDQYRYVVRGENRAKRKILLVLSVLSALLTIAVIFGFAGLAGMVYSMSQNIGYGASEEVILRSALSSLMGMMSFALPLIALSIAKAVIYFMALYDVYASMDPDNKTLYLVLSIVVGVTKPFLLFFNRDKDLGMPPRRQEPAYVPQEPQWQQPSQEPWELPPQEPDYR